MYQYTGDPTRSRGTRRRTLDWVREVQERGAGEIVLNCMASDGVREGYDIAQLRGACADLPRAADRLRRRRRAGAFRRGLRRGATSMARWPRACSTAARSASASSSATCAQQHVEIRP